MWYILIGKYTFIFLTPIPGISGQSSSLPADLLVVGLQHLSASSRQKDRRCMIYWVTYLSVDVPTLSPHYDV